MESGHLNLTANTSTNDIISDTINTTLQPIPNTISASTINANASSRKRDRPWKDEFGRLYGLNVISRDEDTGRVTCAMCRFCHSFGREEKIQKYPYTVKKEGQTDACAKKTRRRTTNVKKFSLFRSDNFVRHLTDQHPVKYAEYCSLLSAELSEKANLALNPRVPTPFSDRIKNFFSVTYMPNLFDTNTAKMPNYSARDQKTNRIEIALEGDCNEGENPLVQLQPIDMLWIGTSHFATGYSHYLNSDNTSTSGVALPCLFDFRRRGKVGRIGLCGNDGSKFPYIKAHLQRHIAEPYNNMDITLECWPDENIIDSRAHVDALATFFSGDACAVFTREQDSFHIAFDCVKRGLHTLMHSSVLKNLEQHKQICIAARETGAFSAIENYLKMDPIYSDARCRIAKLGKFNYLHCYMTLPKESVDVLEYPINQKPCEISSLLNYYHIDFHVWASKGVARPIRVTGTLSSAVPSESEQNTAYTSTLVVQWENFEDGSLGTAVYSSASVDQSNCSKKREKLYYVGENGDLNISPGQCGYEYNTNSNGSGTTYPLYMKYSTSSGYFEGQVGYAYRSLESFVNGARKANAYKNSSLSLDGFFSSLEDNLATSAILEAGKLSIENGSKMYCISYDGPQKNIPTNIVCLS